MLLVMADEGNLAKNFMDIRVATTCRFESIEKVHSGLLKWPLRAGSSRIRLG